MKYLFAITALSIAIIASSPLHADETYGPVITVKPKGLTEASQEQTEQGKVKKGQETKRTGLLLPAVQKAQESNGADASQQQGQQQSFQKKSEPPKPTGLLLPAVQKAQEEGGENSTDGKVKAKDQKRGGLDRDIIRR